jgi:choline dehydrogenase-like flavoprotein
MHDAPNAFVLSAASLPTCSHANPTLTLVAMAARLANHLRAGGAMAASATQ